MNIRRSLLFAAVLAVQGASASSFAATSPVLAPGSHVSGGISEEAREEMQAQQGLYNLQLAFAETRTGAYLAGVTVTVEPAGRGESFGPFADCGPLFQIALSPGAYKVVASYGGVTRTQTVRVGKGATRITLYWPEAPEH